MQGAHESVRGRGEVRLGVNTGQELEGKDYSTHRGFGAEQDVSWEEPQGGWSERVGDGHGGSLE